MNFIPKFKTSIFVLFKFYIFKYEYEYFFYKFTCFNINDMKKT